MERVCEQVMCVARVCAPLLSPHGSFASGSTRFPAIQRGSLGGAAGGFPGGPIHHLF